MNVIKNIKKNLKAKKPTKIKNLNLLELNLSNIEKYFEILCSILVNLEPLSLRNNDKIKFLHNDSSISLNKLKHLFLDNISFDNEQMIKIDINNLVYSDIRIKEKEVNQMIKIQKKIQNLEELKYYLKN